MRVLFFRHASLLLFLSAQLCVFAASQSDTQTPEEVCTKLSTTSAIFSPGTAEYTADNYHFSLSSSETSACSVEPDSPWEVGEVLKILGATRTPFAVKGGGHSMNPGFSSTIGILISMVEFNNVVFHPENQTVDIGSGLKWGEVYARLEPFNVTVVGGRAPEVGVAGFLAAGGGYSYKTNQYGLGVDSIVALEVVLPSGEVQTVTKETNNDLFFAFRGGGNNFGIVTKFTMKAVPQTLVWGGGIQYELDQAEKLSAALADYTTNTLDPKSALAYVFGFANGQNRINVALSYDDPTLPVGIFDAFLDIPSVAKDVGTRSYLSLVQSSSVNSTAGLRGVYNTASHSGVTSKFIAATMNETFIIDIFQYHAKYLQSQSLVIVDYIIEPFLPSAYHHDAPQAPTPFPPSRSQQPIYPMNIHYSWNDSAADDTIIASVRESAETLKSIAKDEGIYVDGLYPNYALFGTEVEDMLGAKNVARLREIKSQTDPQDVMGLAGGFKI